MMPRWMAACYLSVVITASCSTFFMGWTLLKSQAETVSYRTESAARKVEMDGYWKRAQEAEEKLRWFQDSCRGMNCNEIFSNDAAGVVTATYTAMNLSVGTLADMCHYDERVNLGQNYPGAKLIAFGLTEGHSMGKVNGEHMVHCDWVIPSHTWCQKE